MVQSIAVAFEHSVLRAMCGKNFPWVELHGNDTPGIHKSLEAMQALCVSVIAAEHSFHNNPRNIQC